MITMHPNECLYKVSKEVEENESGISELFDEMDNELQESNGVGIAAPQLGVNKRVVLINYKSTKTFIINPVIIKRWGGLKTREEGCLSCPGITRKVLRYNYIKVSGYDIDFNKFNRTFSRQLACIAQHEIDHLNGITLINKK